MENNCSQEEYLGNKRRTLAKYFMVFRKRKKKMDTWQHGYHMPIKRCSDDYREKGSQRCLSVFGK